MSSHGHATTSPIQRQRADFMAIDQDGKMFHALGSHPRQALLHRLGRQKAAKMYIDTPDGPQHVGYVIAGHWLRLYRVEAWQGRA